MPPPAPPADDPAKKPIDVHAWGRVGMYMHSYKDPKKMDQLTSDGEAEIHFDGQATKEIGVTINGVATYGPSSTGGDITGSFGIMDLIARFDIMDEFHVWGGRMLVPSDRSNFSGPYFMAPWYYPGTYSPHGYIGPRQGPAGRNDGATVWGDFGKGRFKYYAGAFDLYKSTGRPLWSGRLALALLDPEPGLWGTSTYYGSQDVLSIGVGGQFQKNASVNATTGADDDFSEINADVLFEKKLGGVLDVEGAFYGYGGRYEPFKLSYMALASFLLPDNIGPGKLQPMVRWQSAKARETDKMDSALDAQFGYVISGYTRLALGYMHTDNSKVPGNTIYLGAQILK
jgi:hypothetical protein